MAKFACGPSAQGIEPAKAGKQPEIATVGMEFALVLDGQCGQMGVRHEVATHASSIQQGAKERVAARPGVNPVNIRTFEPRVEHGEGILN